MGPRRHASAVAVIVNQGNALETSENVYIYLA